MARGSLSSHPDAQQVAGGDAVGRVQLAPWAVLAPAAATVVTVMIFNLLGDAVRDALDPEVRT